MMNRCSMMDWSCMVGGMMYRSMVGVNMRRNWFSIFIQLWFRVVWVLVRVGV